RGHGSLQRDEVLPGRDGFGPKLARLLRVRETSNERVNKMLEPRSGKSHPSGECRAAPKQVFCAPLRRRPSLVCGPVSVMALRFPRGTEPPGRMCLSSRPPVKYAMSGRGLQPQVTAVAAHHKRRKAAKDARTPPPTGRYRHRPDPVVPDVP